VIFYSNRLGQLQVQKKTSKNLLNFYVLWDRSISIEEALIHSMFISDVNNMRNFIFGEIVASLRKNNI
jgi:hypothetical protein